MTTSRHQPSYSAVRNRQHFLRLMIAVPAVVLGIGSYWFAQVQLTHEVESRMRWLSVHKAEELTDWLDELKLDMTTIGRLTPLREWVSHWGDEPERMTDSINQYLHVIHEVFERRYDGFAVFGAGGRLRSVDVGSWIIDSAAFKAAAAGSTTVVFRPTELGRQADIRAYAPIVSPDHGVAAVLAGLVSDEMLLRSLTDLYSPPGQNVFMIDSTGLVLTCRPEHRFSSTRLGTGALLAAAQIGADTVVRYDSPDGEQRIGALHWVPRLGWGVLTERDAREAFGPLDRWRFVIAGAVLVVIGLGFALSTVLGNRMMRQLETREHELRSTHEQLITADRLASVGMMAASVAHEVNNPLTTIKVLIHSVAERLRGTSDVQQDLEIALGEIDKIKALVLRFLQFARPRDPEFAPVDLNETLRRVAALIRPQAQARQLTISEEYEADIPSVLADAAQLGQVFINILFNAVEAAPQGGSLRITSRRTNGNAAIAEIWNSGEGITPELTEQVFEPFWSTKATGTGLGLPIARIIIDKHHGELRAQGHGDAGTSFYITLPGVSTETTHAARSGS